MGLTCTLGAVFGRIPSSPRRPKALWAVGSEHPESHQDNARGWPLVSHSGVTQHGGTRATLAWDTTGNDGTFSFPRGKCIPWLLSKPLCWVLEASSGLEGRNGNGCHAGQCQWLFSIPIRVSGTALQARNPPGH